MEETIKTEKPGFFGRLAVFFLFLNLSFLTFFNLLWSFDSLFLNPPLEDPNNYKVPTGLSHDLFLYLPPIAITVLCLYALNFFKRLAPQYRHYNLIFYVWVLSIIVPFAFAYTPYFFQKIYGYTPDAFDMALAFGPIMHLMSFFQLLGPLACVLLLIGLKPLKPPSLHALSLFERGLLIIVSTLCLKKFIPIVSYILLTPFTLIQYFYAIPYYLSAYPYISWVLNLWAAYLIWETWRLKDRLNQSYLSPTLISLGSFLYIASFLPAFRMNIRWSETVGTGIDHAYTLISPISHVLIMIAFVRILIGVTPLEEPIPAYVKRFCAHPITHLRQWGLTVKEKLLKLIF